MGGTNDQYARQENKSGTDGLQRLLDGCEHRLTRSEIARGYFFITLDRDLRAILEVDDFDVDFDGTRYTSRRRDVSGRIRIPREELARLGEGRVLTVKLINRRLIRIRPLRSYRRRSSKTSKS